MIAPLRGGQAGLLDLVVSCTASKTLLPAEGTYPRLGDIAARPPLSGRLEVWRDFVDGEIEARPLSLDDCRHHAKYRYRGQYWGQVHELATWLRQLSRWGGVRVMVVSAGLGLIWEHVPIPAYSATFAAGHPDSVIVPGGGRHAEQRREWWRLLTAGGPLAKTTRMPRGGLPARLADLDGDEMIVCLGRSYLEAVHHDLAERLRRRVRGVRIYASGEPLPGLAAAWIRAGAADRARLGGGMVSLLPRYAHDHLRGDLLGGS